ncbi:MAG: YbaB/EbfC family nucleoid-associated protein [Patescibacteria group bacterium]
MGMLGQVRDMYKLQKQAKQIKKELANIHIEAETDGVLVTVNAEMEVISVKIPEELKSTENAEKLGAAIVSAANKGIKKAQEIAAEKMKGVMAEMQSLMGSGGAPAQN